MKESEKRINKAGLGSPFTGLAPKRKIAKFEVVRADQAASVSEDEITQEYLQLAESINNKMVE